MRRKLGQLLILLTGFMAYATAQAIELTPFRAYYAAQFKLGLAFDGEAVRELKAIDNGQWRLSMDAEAMVASFHESSRFRDQNGLLQSLEYAYQRKALGKKRRRQARFDWDNHTVSGNNATPLPMPADTTVYDKVSYQLQLWRDAMAGKQQMSYQVIDGDQLKTYRYRLLGEEQVSTPSGTYATLVVERDRGGKKKRQTRIWLAKELDFMIVKLQQVEKGKRYEILLDRIQYNP